MSQVVRCDVCGKDVKVRGTASLIAEIPEEKLPEELRGKNQPVISRIDLCEECDEKVGTFIKGMMMANGMIEEDEDDGDGEAEPVVQEG